jgi:hypothetical protein
MRILAAVATILLLSGPGLAAVNDDGAADTDAPAVAATDDATFDSQFQCPETITDRDGQIDEALRYQAWAHLNHPDWTLRKRMDVRYGLLRRHACTVTLANVAASALPPFGK